MLLTHVRLLVVADGGDLRGMAQRLPALLQGHDALGSSDELLNS